MCRIIYYRIIYNIPGLLTLRFSRKFQAWIMCLSDIYVRYLPSCTSIYTLQPYVGYPNNFQTFTPSLVTLLFKWTTRFPKKSKKSTTLFNFMTSVLKWFVLLEKGLCVGLKSEITSYSKARCFISHQDKDSRFTLWVSNTSYPWLRLGKFHTNVNASSYYFSSFFFIYDIGAVLPLLAAKQRVTHSNDWMSTDAEIACPDPHCKTRLRITRVGLRTFSHAEVTVVPLASKHDEASLWIWIWWNWSGCSFLGDEIYWERPRGFLILRHLPNYLND